MNHRKLHPAPRQAVIVKNRPGGGSNIGAELAAKAQPVAYTLNA
jgi:tripartite-type tricarboxylate transporter receptor subunit TctC